MGVYPDPANPGDEFCEILDYNFPVTYSQMVPELRPPDLEQGVGVEQVDTSRWSSYFVHRLAACIGAYCYCTYMLQDAGDAEDVLDDLDDSELVSCCSYRFRQLRCRI